MQTQDLKIYCHLYDLRSINQTARQLRYSQSNITARLKVLENELQVKLFIRSNRGLTPTDAGKRTYAYAQQVLAATTQLQQDLAQQVPHPTVFISELLFNFLVIYKQAYSLTKYTFKTKRSTEFATAQDFPAQMVITYAPFTANHYQLIEHGWLTASLFGVAHQPILINRDTNCPFRQKTLTMVEKSAPIIEVDSWNDIITLVQQGRGIALLPNYLGTIKQLAPLATTAAIKIPYKIFSRQESSAS